MSHLTALSQMSSQQSLAKNPEPIGQSVVLRILQLNTFNNNNTVCMKARNAIHYWMPIGTYVFLLDMIAYGYRISFLETPPAFHLNNNQSAIKYVNFVIGERLFGKHN